MVVKVRSEEELGREEQYSLQVNSSESHLLLPTSKCT
jgi:hypothetical protein